MNHLHAPVRRRLARAVALTPATLLAVAAGPALATAPEQWEKPDPVSGLHALLILLVIPAGLFLVITLLALLPSIIRGEKYTPGLAWHNEAEWFGGPRGGVESADQVSPQELESDKARGGASAGW